VKTGLTPCTSPTMQTTASSPLYTQCV